MKKPKRSTRTPAAPSDGRLLSIECARICDDFKAEDIVILDVERLLGLTDCFVIATVPHLRAIQAVAEELKHRMAQHGLAARNRDPMSGSGWVLLDFGLFIVHLFDKNLRAFYDLEFLWADAKKIDWQSGKEEAAGNDVRS